MNYDTLLSEKVKLLKPSGIRKYFDIAQSIDGVISLGVGEPDFPTPWKIRKQAISTLENRRTVYTANSGLIELRRAIADYTARTTGVEYSPEKEIIVTVGGSEAIDLAIRSTIEPGDEVLITEPCFVSYAPIVELTGGIPVPIETLEADNFKLMPEALRSKITAKTKLLIFPFPNNPTGAIMTKEDMEPIAEIINETNIAVVSDEIYSELTYGTQHCSFASMPGMREHTIIINGFSKSFAMTGWRLGYSCAPAEITKQMLKIHQFGIMCSPTVSQYAAIEALKSCGGEVRKMNEDYNMRRQLMVSSFRKMGLSCFEPQGAFYVFPSIKSTGLSSDAFCERLLREQKIAVIPGTAFGESGEGYVRVSYAYSITHLTAALERIETFLNSLK